MGCNGSKAASPAVQKAPEMIEGDFKVSLERMAEETVGLSIAALADNTFSVQAVKEEGLVPAWNKQQENTPEVMVKEGDVIVAVNQVFGDVEAMKKEMASKQFVLNIKRASSAVSAVEPNVAESAADTQPVAEPEAEQPSDQAAVSQEKSTTPVESATVLEPVTSAEQKPDAAADPGQDQQAEQAAPIAATVAEQTAAPADAAAEEQTAASANTTAAEEAAAPSEQAGATAAAAPEASSVTEASPAPAETSACEAAVTEAAAEPSASSNAEAATQPEDGTEAPTAITGECVVTVDGGEGEVAEDEREARLCRLAMC